MSDEKPFTDIDDWKKPVPVATPVLCECVGSFSPNDKFDPIAEARREVLRLMRAFVSHDSPGLTMYADLAEILTAARRMVELEGRST